jgi:hypothetical protein
MLVCVVVLGKTDNVDVQTCFFLSTNKIRTKSFGHYWFDLFETTKLFCMELHVPL